MYTQAGTWETFFCGPEILASHCLKPQPKPHPKLKYIHKRNYHLNHNPTCNRNRSSTYSPDPNPTCSHSRKPTYNCTYSPY